MEERESASETDKKQFRGRGKTCGEIGTLETDEEEFWAQDPECGIQ